MEASVLRVSLYRRYQVIKNKAYRGLNDLKDYMD